MSLLLSNAALAARLESKAVKYGLALVEGPSTSAAPAIVDGVLRPAASRRWATAAELAQALRELDPTSSTWVTQVEDKGEVVILHG